MTTRQTEQNLVHSALFYHSEREYVHSLVRFISEWLSVAEPVLVAVPGTKMASLRDALGAAARDVAMIDVTEEGRNPGRILGLENAFVARHPNRPVRIIGETVWPGRAAVEYPACVQHEAMVNVALAEQEVTYVCPYDASSLAEGVLADARATHPLIWRGGSHQHSPEYAVDAALERSNEPLSTSPAAVTYGVRRSADLSGARRCATRYGRLLGMSADRIADLLLIATELASNSLQHTDGACRLAFWHQDGHLVCEARDVGHFDDPLAGRRPPGKNGSGPYGLFVVNAVADLVRVYTSPAGTTIHAYLRLDRSGEAA